MLIYVETRVPGAGGEGRLLVPLGVHVQYKTGPRVPGCRQGSLRRWDCLGGLVVEGVKGVCLCSALAARGGASAVGSRWRLGLEPASVNKTLHLVQKVIK